MLEFAPPNKGMRGKLTMRLRSSTAALQLLQNVQEAGHFPHGQPLRATVRGLSLCLSLSLSLSVSLSLSDYINSHVCLLFRSNLPLSLP